MSEPSPSTPVSISTPIRASNPSPSTSTSTPTEPTSLTSPSTSTSTSTPSQTSQPPKPTHTIHFTLSNITSTWSPTRPIPILKVAEEAGLKPNFGCRSGMCGTCEVRLLKGDVEGPEGDGDMGILICSSRPVGKGGVVEIEL